MKRLQFASALLLFALCVPRAGAAEKVNVAEDDSTQSAAYGGGWSDHSNGGTGFGAWVQRTAGTEIAGAYAGFFIADAASHSDLNAVALEEKAFGMFANGVGFEAACAFRSFDRPLAAGDTFSIVLEHGPIAKKFDSDSAEPGSFGFSLRSGAKADSWEDVGAGARVEFGLFEGAETYQVIDGETSRDTGVAQTDAGVAVAVTLVTADTYNLEITTLGDGKTTKLAGRKLGGAAGSPIESFSVFNRDGEKNDFYFNSPRVSRDFVPGQ
jgi:hypothetical protein